MILKRFIRYVGVGGVNTFLHWVTFLMLYYVLHVDQAFSNLIAFGVAVTFSFYANATITFKTRTTPLIKYIAFVIFMGVLSLAVGWVADQASLSPWLTLIIFSAISMFSGFVFMQYVLFSRDS